jgi:hypothetical protein
MMTSANNKSPIAIITYDNSKSTGKTPYDQRYLQIFNSEQEPILGCMTIPNWQEPNMTNGNNKSLIVSKIQ